MRPLRVAIDNAADDIQSAHTDIDKKKIGKKEYKRIIQDAGVRIVVAYREWVNIAIATARLITRKMKLNGLNDRVYFVDNPNVPMPLEEILYKVAEDYVYDLIHSKWTLKMRVRLQMMDAELKDFAQQMKEEYPSCFCWAIDNL
jgi:hypothetical protein